MNFDWFFVCGCALIAGPWERGRAGDRAGISRLPVLSRRILGPAARPTWIITEFDSFACWRFGSISWLAGEAGRLTRNLEQSVHERTGRLQSEVSQHRQTTELLSEAIELFRQVTRILPMSFG